MIPHTGDITLEQIGNEFGVPGPQIALDMLYAGGAYVPANQIRNASNAQALVDGLQFNEPVPSSGQISLANFHGITMPIDMSSMMPTSSVRGGTLDDGTRFEMEFGTDGTNAFCQFYVNGVADTRFELPTDSLLGDSIDVKVIPNAVSNFVVMSGGAIVDEWFEIEVGKSPRFGVFALNNENLFTFFDIEYRQTSMPSNTLTDRITLTATNTSDDPDWGTLPYSYGNVNKAAGNTSVSVVLNALTWDLLLNGVIERGGIEISSSNQNEVSYSIISGNLDINPSGLLPDTWHRMHTDGAVELGVSCDVLGSDSLVMDLSFRYGPNLKTVRVEFTVDNVFSQDITFTNPPSESKVSIERLESKRNELLLRQDNGEYFYTFGDGGASTGDVIDFNGNLWYEFPRWKTTTNFTVSFVYHATATAKRLFGRTTLNGESEQSFGCYHQDGSLYIRGVAGNRIFGGSLGLNADHVIEISFTPANINVIANGTSLGTVTNDVQTSSDFIDAIGSYGNNQDMFEGHITDFKIVDDLTDETVCHYPMRHNIQSTYPEPLAIMTNPNDTRTSLVIVDERADQSKSLMANNYEADTNYRFSPYLGEGVRCQVNDNGTQGFLIPRRKPMYLWVKLEGGDKKNVNERVIIDAGNTKISISAVGGWNVVGDVNRLLINRQDIPHNTFVDPNLYDEWFEILLDVSQDITVMNIGSATPSLAMNGIIQSVSMLDESAPITTFVEHYHEFDREALVVDAKAIMDISPNPIKNGSFDYGRDGWAGEATWVASNGSLQLTPYDGVTYKEIYQELSISQGDIIEIEYRHNGDVSIGAHLQGVDYIAHPLPKNVTGKFLITATQDAHTIRMHRDFADQESGLRGIDVELYSVRVVRDGVRVTGGALPNPILIPNSITSNYDWLSLGNFGTGNLEYKRTHTTGVAADPNIAWTDVVGETTDRVNATSIARTILPNGQQTTNSGYTMEFRQKVRPSNSLTRNISLESQNRGFAVGALTTVGLDTTITHPTNDDSLPNLNVGFRLRVSGDNLVFDELKGNVYSNPIIMSTDNVQYEAKVEIIQNSNLVLEGYLPDQWIDIDVAGIEGVLHHAWETPLNTVVSGGYRVDVRQKNNHSNNAVHIFTMQSTNLLQRVAWNPKLGADNTNFQLLESSPTTHNIKMHGKAETDIMFDQHYRHGVATSNTLQAADVDVGSSVGLEFFLRNGENYVSLIRNDQPTDHSFIVGDLSNALAGRNESWLGSGSIDIRITQLTTNANLTFRNLVDNTWTTISETPNENGLFGMVKGGHGVTLSVDDTTQTSVTVRLEIRSAISSQDQPVNVDVTLNLKGGVVSSVDNQTITSLGDNMPFTSIGNDTVHGDISFHRAQNTFNVVNRIDDTYQTYNGWIQDNSSDLFIVITSMTQLYSGTNITFGDQNGNDLVVGKIYKMGQWTDQRTDFDALTNIRTTSAVPADSIGAVSIKYKVFPIWDMDYDTALEYEVVVGRSRIADAVPTFMATLADASFHTAPDQISDPASYSCGMRIWDDGNNLMGQHLDEAGNLTGSSVILHADVEGMMVRVTFPTNLPSHRYNDPTSAVDPSDAENGEWTILKAGDVINYRYGVDSNTTQTADVLVDISRLTTANHLTTYTRDTVRTNWRFNPNNLLSVNTTPFSITQVNKVATTQYTHVTNISLRYNPATHVLQFYTWGGTGGTHAPVTTITTLSAAIEDDCEFSWRLTYLNKQVGGHSAEISPTSRRWYDIDKQVPNESIVSLNNWYSFPFGAWDNNLIVADDNNWRVSRHNIANFLPRGGQTYTATFEMWLRRKSNPDVIYKKAITLNMKRT